MSTEITRESGDRAAFLATFRRAVAAEHHGGAGHSRPITPLPNDGVASVGYAGETEFGHALTAIGGVVRHLVDAASLISFVDELLTFARTPGVRGSNSAPLRVAMTNEPECAAVAYALGSRDDVEVVDYTDAAAIATVDIGFTGARAGVARTGSIVVDAARAGGRTVSLLPPLHVALLNRHAIVSEPGDLWRSLPASLASNLVQITGPSRSADIELVITLGVHGPRALWVGLIDVAPESR
ncbi:MAG TPA: LUD domain-containing protein [Acidimicrobiales bacterium]|nr:LUD domain-containing protein [Acidimicrobiales bacterium]